MDQTTHVVAGLFGRVAAGYDQAGFLHQVAGRLVAHADVRPGMRVLDVACGTGAALLEAARRADPGGLAVGIDVAEPMVAQAAQRLRALGRGPAAVAVMDAEQLGLRPASFDVVCMASAVYLLAEPTAVLRGLRKLLRPGGRLAVSDFGSLDERWAWKHELVARYAGTPPVEQLGGDLHGPADLEHLLRWTDATSVTIQVERLDVVHADPAAWWAEQWTHGERWALERMDDQALAAYQVAAFAAIEACREADGAIHWRPEVIYAVAST